MAVYTATRAAKSRAWFVTKIRELGELLKRMPEGRQDLLWREIKPGDDAQGDRDDRASEGA